MSTVSKHQHKNMSESGTLYNVQRLLAFANTQLIAFSSSQWCYMHGSAHDQNVLSVQSWLDVHSVISAPLSVICSWHYGT